MRFAPRRGSECRHAGAGCGIRRLRAESERGAHRGRRAAEQSSRNAAHRPRSVDGTGDPEKRRAPAGAHGAADAGLKLTYSGPFREAAAGKMGPEQCGPAARARASPIPPGRRRGPRQGFRRKSRTGENSPCVRPFGPYRPAAGAPVSGDPFSPGTDSARFFSSFLRGGRKGARIPGSAAAYRLPAGRGAGSRTPPPGADSALRVPRGSVHPPQQASRCNRTIRKNHEESTG